MGAHPGAPGGDVPQHRIEGRPVLPSCNRIDPDEHAVEPEKLLAHLIRNSAA